MAASLGPEWELQDAIVTALNASADIQALLGVSPRIYEDVPAKPEFPYVTLGEAQNVPNSAECIDGADCFCDLHIWSIASSFKECKSIAATILAVVTAATLTMTQNRVVDCYGAGIRHLRDPDGTTRHSVLTLKALTEPL